MYLTSLFQERNEGVKQGLGLFQASSSPSDCDVFPALRLRTWRRKKFNPLTPNDHYSGRTAPPNSKRCILYIYSTNIGTEYFKHGIYTPFFFLFRLQFVS